MSSVDKIERVAVIADIHYNYDYNVEYDKFKELSRAIAEILEHKPDAIFVLGDFFDYRRTDSGGSLSIDQGDRKRNPLVNLINETTLPWFIILGNHEKVEILNTFENLCPNLFFLYTDETKGKGPIEKKTTHPVDIGTTILWGSKIQEKSNQPLSKDAVLKAYAKTAKEMTTGKNKIFLTHLNLIKGKGCDLDDNTFQELNNSFDLVLNGHEHTLKIDGLNNYNNIKLAPALLPWYVKKNQGFIQKLEFKSGKLEEISKLRFPNGYLMLDLKSLEFEFQEFKTSIPHVQLHYYVTDKDLERIANELKEIASKIVEMYVGKHNITKIIVKPIIEGKLQNLIIYQLNRVFNEIQEEIPAIFITQVSEGDSFEKDKVIQEGEMNQSETKWTNIIENIKNEPKNLITKLEEMGIEWTETGIKKILATILEKDSILNKGNNLYSTASSYVNQFLDIFNDEFELDLKTTEVENIISEANNLGGK